jgi:hypothetical protein
MNSYSQIVLRTVNETKELIQGKWDLYEYCVYEANFCKKDSSSSLIFNTIIGENKLGYTLMEKGVIVKKGIVGIYDFVKVRTNDKYTLDNFLFSTDYALIVSFLDSNTLGLLQDSNQGYAKHYKRDKNYKAEPIILMNSEK